MLRTNDVKERAVVRHLTLPLMVTSPGSAVRTRQAPPNHTNTHTPTRCAYAAVQQLSWLRRAQRSTAEHVQTIC
jgi:hypothetical protein